MRILIPLLAATALAACTSSGDSPQSTASRNPDTCFLSDDVAGWKDAGRGRFNLRTARGEVYTAELLGPCPEADFSQQLAVVPRFSRRICQGDDATLLVPSRVTERVERCRIDNIRRLSPDEAAALPPTEKP